MHRGFKKIPRKADDFVRKGGKNEGDRFVLMDETQVLLRPFLLVMLSYKRKHRGLVVGEDCEMGDHQQIGRTINQGPLKAGWINQFWGLQSLFFCVISGDM